MVGGYFSSTDVTNFYSRLMTLLVSIDPSNIGGLTLWFDATRNVYNDAGVTLATNGQTVQQWNDQQATSNLSQATALNRPTFVTNVQNGLPIVRFSIGGTGMWMQTGSITLNSPVTIFIVFNERTLSAPGGNDAILDSYGTNNSLLFQSNSPIIGFFAASANISAAANYGVGTFAQLTIVSNGASSSIRVAGSQIASGNPGTGNPGGLTLGGQGGVASGRWSNTDIGEVLVYNSALSAANIANVENYLKLKWGL
jgi:hypothetical protein